MTLEKKRIKIAEACGWKRGKESRTSFANPATEIEYSCWVSPNGIKTNKTPDYFNDLNAMHEAEKVLTEQQQATFALFLHQNSMRIKDDHLGRDFDCIHATASQHAEAFGLTLKLWT